MNILSVLSSPFFSESRAARARHVACVSAVGLSSLLLFSACGEESDEPSEMINTAGVGGGAIGGTGGVSSTGGAGGGAAAGVSSAGASSAGASSGGAAATGGAGAGSTNAAGAGAAGDSSTAGSGVADPNAFTFTELYPLFTATCGGAKGCHADGADDLRRAYGSTDEAVAQRLITESIATILMRINLPTDDLTLMPALGGKLEDVEIAAIESWASTL